MFAIIETGGKQIIVKEKDHIYIEKLDQKAGSKVNFDKVLAIKDEIGNPYLKNVSVSGVIKKHDKAKKIVVYRHNKKSTHKKKQGHRQPYSLVEIKKIEIRKGV